MIPQLIRFFRSVHPVRQNGIRTIHSKIPEFEVTLTSQDLIKPSSPTLTHLRLFRLSLLDQLVSYPYTPVILFYGPNFGKPGDLPLNVPQKLEVLKKSLSRTLARFYPLAGKIREDGLFVECDDRGARFLETRVNVSLAEFLTDPDLNLLHKLFPYEPGLKPFSELTHAANVQVNVFECGGIALAIGNSHKLQDGGGMTVFMKEWTAIARGGNSDGTAVELAGAADLFPASEQWLKDLIKSLFGRSLSKTGSWATRRFLFTGSAVESIRALGRGPQVENPTRVEAISGFLWKCIMDASRRKNNGIGRPSTFTHAVNIRKRTNPPMSDYSLGKLLWWAIASYKNDDNNNPRRAADVVPCLVGELRGAISNVDSDFLLGLSRDKNSVIKSLGRISEVGSSSEADHITCTSMSRFGFYDADFGWGRPVWVNLVGWTGQSYTNLISLNTTRSGNGIEASVTLDKDELSLLQEDPELRPYASVDPSPLKIGIEQ